MRVLLAAGGTAGHINPAIAIAKHIVKEQPDAQILFAGVPSGMEFELVQKAGFDIVPIKVGGFRRSFSLENIKHNFKSAYMLLSSDMQAKKIIKEFNPDIVIGAGGYVSGPIVNAATSMKIKTAIHEQNAFPGVTNKILAKKADIVFVATEESIAQFKNPDKCIVVGNPVRDSIIFKTKEEARKNLGLDDKICILSFGGSLGARIINRAAADLIEWNDGEKINHIHGFGRLGKEIFPEMIKERNIDLSKRNSTQINEYIHNMEDTLVAADIVICRSGAISISELEVAGKASILIPSPYVAENHQYHNAMVLVKNEAALIIEEKDYDKDEFIAQIEKLYNSPELIKAMAKNASKLAILDTAKRIYDEIIRL